MFPEGTPGSALDTLARLPLWADGLNYRHGTGHGVGAALNVHEGPQSISTRYYITTPLQVRVVLSSSLFFTFDRQYSPLTSPQYSPVFATSLITDLQCSCRLAWLSAMSQATMKMAALASVLKTCCPSKRPTQSFGKAAAAAAQMQC